MFKYETLYANCIKFNLVLSMQVLSTSITICGTMYSKCDSALAVVTVTVRDVNLFDDNAYC